MLLENPLYIPAALEHIENRHRIVFLYAMQDDVIARRKLRRPGDKSSRRRPTYGCRARSQKRSVMASITPLAISRLPLSRAMCSQMR
jgi:hypothetical protein